MLTSWSLVCWLPKGKRFRAEVTIECGIFLGCSVLWEVFPVRDRFLMFSCLLVISSRSSSFCVLWQVEANISKFLFRRRTLSWQLLQQNLGSSSLSETSISHTLRIILFNCNAFPLSLKKWCFLAVVSPHNRHLLFKISSVKVWDPSMSHDSWSGHPKNRENLEPLKEPIIAFVLSRHNF